MHAALRVALALALAVERPEEARAFFRPTAVPWGGGGAGRAAAPPPPSGAPLRAPKRHTTYFAHIGDWGINNREQRKVANALARVAEHYDIAAVVTGGDNFYANGVSSTRDPRFRACFEEQYEADALKVPWYPSLGDHDVCGSVEAQIEYSKVSDRWDMTAPYYARTLAARSPDGANATLVFLIIETTSLEALFAPEEDDVAARRFNHMMDPRYTGKEAGERQLAWIQSAAAEARRKGADWIVAVGHKPAITAADRRWRGSGATRELGGRMWFAEAVLVNGALHDALVGAGVDVMLAGHDHSLQHLESNATGFTTLISGAAGYGSSAPGDLNIDPEHGSYVWHAPLRDGEGGFAVHGLDAEGRLHAAFFDANGRELWAATLNKKCARGDGPPIASYRCVGSRGGS